MKFYLIVISVTLILSVILYFLGSPNWEIKMTGGFFVISIVLMILGWIKATELLIKYKIKFESKNIEP